MVCDKGLCEEGEEGRRMMDDKNELFRRRAIDNIFNELLGRSLVTEEPLDKKEEASEKYKTLKTLGFLNGLYRACYDDLCLAEKVRIPFDEYVGEEDVVRYRGLLNEIMLKLEELSDMLWMMDDEMREKLDVWGEEEE